jgi:hypothetical protein
MQATTPPVVHDGRRRGALCLSLVHTLRLKETAAGELGSYLGGISVTTKPTRSLEVPMLHTECALTRPKAPPTKQPSAKDKKKARVQSRALSWRG